ncbi:MAG TPA: membrane protein insertase YidC, partial [Candidatus Saccharimonadia bacterium]|nr:membrane protein insertase YidC [Candidatus Saccharimonadia bacterium]
MPNIRSFLLIALALVAFLLWQAWQTDYAALKSDTPAPVVDERPAAAPPSDAPSAAEIPPAAPGDAAVPPSVAGPEPDALPRITVETDLLRVEIDPRGGTIVGTELLAYPVSPREAAPVVLFDDSAARYYVAQAGLVSATGAAPDHRAVYESAASRYALGSAETVEVPLRWTDASGVSVTKTYVFTRGSYVVGMRDAIVNSGSTPWSGSIYRQLQRVAPPSVGKFSFTNPEQYSFVGAAWYSDEERFEKLAFDEFVEEPFAREITGGWSAMLQHYFVAAWLPPATERNSYSTEVINGNGATRYLLRQLAAPVTIAPGATTTLESRLYLGPKLQELLPEVAPGLGATIDYGKVTVLAEPLFWLLNWLYKLLGNWGFAIIAVTVLIKLAFFKLSEAQYRSMARMRKVQPRLAALKERYGDDKQKMNQAMMELYQKEKINPFGGCLPILVQIPVFIALYWVLIESVELRHAPFIGWIQSLSERDPYFVLPVLNGLAMYAAQRLTPAPGMDPMQQKIMQMMPIMFAVMFAFFKLSEAQYRS